jgi:KaiC/GvpD/RAD55 family RecA-like ATPase
VARGLSRALHFSGEPAEPPWPNLAWYLTPRTGNLMVVAAASGVGKSMFALNWTLRLAQQHLPCLYVSLDTDYLDQAVRLLAATSHQTTEAILAGRDSDPSAWGDRWSGVLTDLCPPQLRFTDRPSTIRHIKESILAEAELFGRPPLITVVDNVADLLEQEEGPAEYHRIFGELRQVAKDTKTMVMALHHLRRKPARFGEHEQDQGTKPVMKTDVLYGGDREAQYVVGLWRQRQDILSVSVLKNRMGRADPSSNVNVRLRADYERALVTYDPILDAGVVSQKPAHDDDRRRWEEIRHG